jgi:hypothetical protein
MRKSYLYFLLFLLFFLPVEIKAGTLENLDFQEYNIQMTYDNGQISHEPIYGQSTSYICVYGCTLELMETGQKIEMHPNDYIIIENGVLKRKENEE